MSDLISRSALIKKFEDDMAEGLVESFDDVIGIVEEQPVAYDKEAVVKQLEEASYDEGLLQEHIVRKIVKAGGIDG